MNATRSLQVITFVHKSLHVCPCTCTCTSYVSGSAFIGAAAALVPPACTSTSFYFQNEENQLLLSHTSGKKRKGLME